MSNELSLPDRRLMLAYLVCKSDNHEDATNLLLDIAGVDYADPDAINLIAEFFSFPEHIISELLLIYPKIGKLAATMYLLQMMNNRELQKLAVLVSINP